MFEQFSAQRYRTDTAILVFQPDGTRGIELSPLFKQGIFHMLIAGLNAHADATESRTPMAGKAFQIHHLSAQRSEFVQNFRFAAAGHAAQDKCIDGFCQF